jgi:hypothetical protein
VSERWAVLVTGSRDWTDSEAIGRVLEPYQPGTVLIHGDAGGADTYAAGWGEYYDYVVLDMPAQWKRDGKGAGPARNYAMLDVLLALRRCGYDVAVLAFPLPQSRGTRHMMQIARAAKVDVFDYGEGRE